MRYHHGRLIDHVHLRVSDFDSARDFYLGIFEALGLTNAIHMGRDWLELDELYIDSCQPGQTPSQVHLCFQALDRDTVDRAYHAGMRNGGRDNGAPGLRDYHPGYYAAFMYDPDGNNVEVKLDERVTDRSASSIVLSDGNDEHARKRQSGQRD